MKKILLLLALFGMLFTACEGGEPSISKIELSQQYVEVEFEPSSYTVQVTSPYSWDAVSKNSWIIIESKTGIAGTKELTFKVERNEEADIREGTIVIKNENYNLIAELYVIQKAPAPSITVGSEILKFPKLGGKQEVAITANVKYDVSSNADWVSCSKTNNGIEVTVPYNDVRDVRTAKITISNKEYSIFKEVNVEQNGINPGEDDFKPEDGEFNG